MCSLSKTVRERKNKTNTRKSQQINYQTRPLEPPSSMLRKLNSQGYSMAYAKREAPILVPIEHKLYSELGLDHSELHKTAIKEFWNRRQQSSLSLI